MFRKINIPVYPIETPAFVFTSKGIQVGLVEQIKIDKNEDVFYGIRLKYRQTLLFVIEDEIHSSVDSLLDAEKEKYNNKFKSTTK